MDSPAGNCFPFCCRKSTSKTHQKHLAEAAKTPPSPASCCGNGDPTNPAFPAPCPPCSCGNPQGIDGIFGSPILVENLGLFFNLALIFNFFLIFWMLFSQEWGIYRAPLVTPSVWDPRAEFPTGVSKGEGRWDELRGTVRGSFWYESGRCSRLGTRIWHPAPGSRESPCPVPLAWNFFGEKKMCSFGENVQMT